MDHHILQTSSLALISGNTASKRAQEQREEDQTALEIAEPKRVAQLTGGPNQTSSNSNSNSEVGRQTPGQEQTEHQIQNVCHKTRSGVRVQQVQESELHQ